MYLLRRQIFIPAPRPEVFTFFEDPGNLAKITPRWMPIKDLTAGYPPMRLGMRIVHPIKWYGIRLAWESCIIEYDPPRRFVDEQTRGPYRSWRHEHDFEEAAGGTVMRDRVQYELPLGILGQMTHRLVVERQLRRIFDYRERRIKQLFAPNRATPSRQESEP